jgi:hypothetical protein
MPSTPIARQDHGRHDGSIIHGIDHRDAPRDERDHRDGNGNGDKSGDGIMMATLGLGGGKPSSPPPPHHHHITVPGVVTPASPMAGGESPVVGGGAINHNSPSPPGEILDAREIKENKRGDRKVTQQRKYNELVKEYAEVLGSYRFPESISPAARSLCEMVSSSLPP